MYVVRYDFVLGENITIPSKSVLEFEGGSISGDGTGKDIITGNNAGIQAGLVKIFNTNITLSGSWNVAEAYPEWFGAKGDSVTDDTNAIQRTLSYFTNCRLSKWYAISSTLIFNNNSHIIGNGVTNTSIIVLNNFSGDYILYNNDNIAHFLISGIYINASNVSVRGIYAKNPYDDCAIRDIHFDNFCKSAIYVGNDSSISQSLVIDNCFVYMSAINPIVEEQMIANMVYEMNIKDSKFLYRQGAQGEYSCIRLNNCYDAYIRGNSFAFSKEYGIHFYGDCRYCRIIGNTYEDIVKGMLYLQGLNYDDIQYFIVQETAYYNASRTIKCENAVGIMSFGFSYIQGGRRCFSFNHPMNNPDGNVSIGIDGGQMNLGFVNISDLQFGNPTYNYGLWANVSDSADYGLRIKRGTTDMIAYLPYGIVHYVDPILMTPNGTMRRLKILDDGSVTSTPV